MGCLIETGLAPLECEDLISLSGGIDTLYLGNKSDLDPTGEFTRGVNKEVTAINFLGYGKLYEFTPLDFTAGATDTITRTDAFVSYIPQAITGTFGYKDQVDTNTINDLIKAKKFFAVVKRTNGKYEVYGLRVGLIVIEGVKTIGNNQSVTSAWALTLGHADGSGEFESAPELTLGSEAATAAYIQTLL